MAARSHLSIGEVLSLLQEEFRDVTISKIRFLESQGLVDPERTPSGYRKFYEGDIERLRWVLRQQRDAFLPLKVIKGRLEGQGDLLGPDDEDLDLAAGTADETGRSVAVAGAAQGPVGAAGAGGPVPGREPVGPAAAGPGSAGNGTAAVAVTGPAPPPSGAGDQLFDVGPPASTVSAAAASRPAVPPDWQGRRPSRPGAGQAAPGRSAGRSSKGVAPRATDEELSLEELVREADVDVATVHELERFGLVVPRVVGGIAYYHPEAAVVVRVAAGFARHGVEARHLRAYKGAAEREAGLVQQVVMPLLRQRNPEAREAAEATADELSRLGGELRTALLRTALGELR